MYLFRNVRPTVKYFYNFNQSNNNLDTQRDQCNAGSWEKAYACQTLKRKLENNDTLSGETDEFFKK